MVEDGGVGINVFVGIPASVEETTVEQAVSQDGADRRMEEKANRCNMVVKVRRMNRTGNYIMWCALDGPLWSLVHDARAA